MKNRLTTMNIRIIKKSLKRFISLVIMSLLGVGVFVGIKAIGPDMVLSLDKYYMENNTYDIEIKGSLGLTEDDVTAIKKVLKTDNVMGSYTSDTVVKHDENEYVVRIHSIPSNINKINIIEGKIPENNEEILVEPSFLNKNDLKIDDNIELLEEKNFKTTKVKIVGIAKSSLYIELESRGTTNLKTGSIEYYFYMLPDNFDIDCYTEIYVNNNEEYLTNSTKYLDLISNTIKSIDSIKAVQEKNRYEEIYNKAINEINEEEEKALKDLAEAKKTLDNAKKELNIAKKELDSSYEKLEKFKKELNKGKSELDNYLNNNSLTIEAVKSNINILENNIASLEIELAYLSEDAAEYVYLSTQINALKGNLSSLKELKNASDDLFSNEKLYETSYEKYLSGIEEYEKGLKKYNKGIKKYNEGKEELNKKIKDAKEELNNIKEAKWYILDRMEHSDYSNFINDTNSIDNLSKIFPTIFFVVAVLISLISMSRMVEDDRSEIGTLKSLGFNKISIMLKYIIYSLLATILGSILGSIFGFYFIPIIIWKVYAIMFDLPAFIIDFNMYFMIIGTFISILTITGTTILVTRKLLKGKPAVLMRPASPKKGKRVMLENVTFIWKRLSFSNKVTLRNLFRYKKRVIMTVVGIMGCTALMLLGFGIRDSIVNIAGTTYGNIFTYNELIYLNEPLTSKEFIEITDDKSITHVVQSKLLTGSAKYNKRRYNINILVADEDISSVINLIDAKTKKIIKLSSEGIIITEKLANLLKINLNDKITIIDNDNKEVLFKVKGIVENYVGHYVFMTKDIFENEFDKYESNALFIKTTNLEDAKEDTLAEKLLMNEKVMNVTSTKKILKTVNNMLGSLNYIVAILIILSAALSFVVFYNLSNINISERQRELATLKVLGFYDKEVDKYITKENLILTFISIAVGLVFGRFLTFWTISSVEVEHLMFIRQINFISYVYAAVITFIFTLIVNVITHYTLTKINMIESLKSIE